MSKGQIGSSIFGVFPARSKWAGCATSSEYVTRRIVAGRSNRIVFEQADASQLCVFEAV